MRRLLVPMLLLTAFALGCPKVAPPGGSTPAPPGGKAAPAERIQLGSVLSFTGQEAHFGETTKSAMEVAVDQINAKGGLLGKKLEVKYLDDTGDPTQAAEAASRLVNQDRVPVVIGEVASTRSMNIGQVCEQKGVVQVTPSSTNPKVTQGKRYVFRVCFTDDFQGYAGAKVAHEMLKARTAAVLEDKANAYSVGLSESFKKAFKGMGGKIAITESYQAGDTEYRAQLTKIKNARVDVLYIPGYYTDCALIATQAREVGLDILLLGGDGWDAPELLTIGGKAVEGAYFTTHAFIGEEREVLQNFVKAYRERYGKDPDALGACGYDAVMVVADAIERAKSLEPAKIRDALEQTTDFPGVTGQITIDENHNAKKKAVVLKVEEGKFAFAGDVPPAGGVEKAPAG